MFDWALVRTFVREIFLRQQEPRGVPPMEAVSAELVLEALTGAGDVNGRYAAGYLFHTGRISQLLPGASTCLDIGAAPGGQILQVAALHPNVQFFGVDNSPVLLKHARAATTALGLSNVEWIQDDIRQLKKLPSNSVDAVISTMTLHYLPDLTSLNQALAAVDRVITSGGALYIEDFARLKSSLSMDYFNLKNAPVETDAFIELNGYSLNAAFTLKELKGACEKHLQDIKFCSTFLIPFLNFAKTEDKDIPPALQKKLVQMRLALNPAQRRDLDDLRKFFALGGLRSDPFA